jgi:hypothetical protein
VSNGDLEERIDHYAATPAGEVVSPEARTTVESLLTALEAGELRAAERGADGSWKAVPLV